MSKVVAMNRVGPMVVAVVLLPGISSAQQAPADAPIQFILPRNIDTGSCQFRYLLVGPFGGYGSFVRSKPGILGYEIETVHDGSAMESLKAFVACPGYQVEAFVFDSLPPPEARRFAVAFKPLASLRFAGVIRGWATPEIQRRYVDVDFMPFWTCGFFNFADCALGGWTLATVPIESDGTFTMNLPDFWRDPIVRWFQAQGYLGHLTFHIRDQTTGNLIFRLQPAESPQRWRGLPVQASYPTEQKFDLEPTR